MEGFILTRQWLETSRGLELIYWLASDEGPLRLHLVNAEAVCFIPATDLEKAHRLLPASGWRTADTALKNFHQKPVVALYCRSRRNLLDYRDRLSKAGVSVYETDIKPTDRFLMERFITGAMKFTGRSRKADEFTEVIPSKVEPSHYRPTLRSLSIDIETDYAMENLYSVALYASHSSDPAISEIATVIMRSESARSEEMRDNYKLQYVPNEKCLLETFLQALKDYDPDILIGWNIVNFDLRMLQKFCERAKLQFTAGRNNESARWRRSQDSTERYYVLIPGRGVLDGIDLMRTATYQFENFSLEHVARRLLGRGKLVDDAHQRGEEITRLFQHDKPALADYNIEDCRLVWDIFEKEKLWDFAVERASLTGLELDRYGGSVAAFDYLYLPRLHRKGYVAPDVEHTDSGGISPGGYVLPSLPGIHEHVIVLDFKSLYPSIIRTFQVDPLALIEGLEQTDAIEGFDGGRFARGEAILPSLIETLWQARDQAKADGNQALSQAIKIIMNSFYGVLGTRGCRFHDPRLVSSITRRGHQIILATQKEIQRRGYRVIYGDTDSVFVLLGAIDSDGSTIDETATRLAANLNRWWQQRIEKEYRVPCHLELQFETHFHKFFMPTVRGTDTGSKKRYAGTVALKDGKGHRLLFKGLETVRSDWSQLARDFQQQLYELVFAEQPFAAYIKRTVQELRDDKFETELLLRKRLRRGLADYVKNIPPHVQAARKADSARHQQGLPELYRSGGWVEYYMTVNGPEPRSHLASAIDYDFYIDKQLAPIADSILVFKSTSLGEILDTQMGLF